MYRFVPDAAWAEPRKAGLYQFDLGNPVRYVDPDGRAVLGGTLLGAEIGAPLGPVGMAAGAVVGTVAAYMVGNAIGHGISSRLHGGGGTIPMRAVLGGASTAAAVAAQPSLANIANLAQGKATALTASKTTTDVTDTPAPTEPPNCDPNETGSIYEVPGTATASGKPYVGRHNKPDPARTRRSADGRDRTQAKKIDTYKPQNPGEGRAKEQQAMNDRGGVDELDNKRNEIREKDWDKGCKVPAMTDKPSALAAEFWRWFANNASYIEPIMSPDLVKELDRQVRALGAFSWELGIAHNGMKQFAISPNGDPALLLGAQAIVQKAPCISGWEFHFAKQPRDAALILLLGDTEPRRRVDARGWTYVLLEYPDGFAELLVNTSKGEHLEEAHRQLAVEIAVDGVIGELERMNAFDAVVAVEEWSSDFEASCRPLAELSKAAKRGPAV